MTPYPLLARVKMTVVHDGVIVTKVGEIIARTIPGETAHVKPSYDLLIAGEVVSGVDASQVELVGEPVRVIDFPYEPSNRMGWPLHVGAAA